MVDAAELIFTITPPCPPYLVDMRLTASRAVSIAGYIQVVSISNRGINWPGPVLNREQ